MTAHTETVVRVTAQLYEARSAVRSLLGPRFADVMANHAALIRRIALGKGISNVAAAKLLAEEAKRCDAPMTATQILAAFVEMIEPTPPEGTR